ncbi:PLP-dependent aminotransferase family protein [Nitriliruptor alkaliphilus]|uniref:aminotransferase-like domain-containing protein n=1 Tax=Nitriliruptor alkaliphilus TaxID=427918 RepID=UPI000696DB9F|nr:PLP-dependent aminotransferase family protein [Nitriliruptor alkaliphilus]
MDEPIRESGPHLADLLQGDLDGEGPLYRQLADALRRAVDRGEVPLGTVLPPERSLARSLAVSRATVVAAYDRLKADGWLESRQGSGTWVRTPDEGDAGLDAVATGRIFLSAGGSEQRTGPGEHEDEPQDAVVDLSVAAVLGSRTVTATLCSLTHEDVAPLTAHHGYLPQGYRALRDAVAARFDTDGLPSRAEQIVVTTGAHQGISLVARQLLRPGDTVLVESPTFPGALDAFRRFGARPVPVPLDEDGMRVDLLEDLIERSDPRLLYVAPHFHNPTGTVLPADRRATIAALAAAHRLPVLEDLAMGDVVLDEDVVLPPPIASYDAAAPIYTLGSTAKLYWAGLRIGWVRSPMDAAARTLAVKTVADLGSPLISQVLALKLIEQRATVQAERRAELRPRRDHLASLLTEHLPEWAFRMPAGGLSLWCRLPRGNAEEFTEHASRHGVVVVPGPALSVDEGNRRALRLVFTCPERELDEGVRRLTHAWGSYSAASDHRPASRLLV